VENPRACSRTTRRASSATSSPRRRRTDWMPRTRPWRPSSSRRASPPSSTRLRGPRASRPTPCCRPRTCCCRTSPPPCDSRSSRPSPRARPSRGCAPCKQPTRTTHGCTSRPPRCSSTA
jgi:hypothetical protein